MAKQSHLGYDYSYGRRVYDAATMGPTKWQSAPVRLGYSSKKGSYHLVPLKVGHYIVENLSLLDVYPTSDSTGIQGPMFPNQNLVGALKSILAKEILVYVCCEEDDQNYNFFDIVLVARRPGSNVIEDMFIYHDQPKMSRGKTPYNTGNWYYYEGIGDKNIVVEFSDDYGRSMSSAGPRAQLAESKFSQLNRFIALCPDDIVTLFVYNRSQYKTGVVTGVRSLDAAAPKAATAATAAPKAATAAKAPMAPTATFYNILYVIPYALKQMYTGDARQIPQIRGIKNAYNFNEMFGYFDSVLIKYQDVTNDQSLVEFAAKHSLGYSKQYLSFFAKQTKPTPQNAPTDLVLVSTNKDNVVCAILILYYRTEKSNMAYFDNLYSLKLYRTDLFDYFVETTEHETEKYGYDGNEFSYGTIDDFFSMIYLNYDLYDKFRPKFYYFTYYYSSSPKTLKKYLDKKRTRLDKYRIKYAYNFLDWSEQQEDHIMSNEDGSYTQLNVLAINKLLQKMRLASKDSVKYIQSKDDAKRVKRHLNSVLETPPNLFAFACCDQGGYTQPTELILLELYETRLEYYSNVKSILGVATLFKKGDDNKTEYVFYYDIHTFKTGQLSVGQLFNQVRSSYFDGILGTQEYTSTKKSGETKEETFDVYQTPIYQFLKMMEFKMEPFVDSHLVNLLRVRDFVFDIVRKNPVQIVSASEELATPAPPTVTSLVKAIESQDLDQVRKLIDDKKQDVNKEEYGITPLIKAIHLNNQRIIALLLRRGADVNKESSRGVTPLVEAIRSRNDALIELVMEKNPDLSTPTETSDPLASAVIMGNIDVVRKLIERGAPVNTYDSHGRTPLSHAAEAQDEAMIRLLIENGADPEIADSDGFKPAVYAQGNFADKLGDASYVLSIGPDADGVTILMKAIKSGEESVVKYLLDNRVDVNYKDSQGRTALFYSVTSFEGHFVEDLVNAGADINATDNEGKTPLMKAVMKAVIGVKTDLVDRLIYLGANLDKVDYKGWTALMYALYTRNTDIQNALLNAGADVNIGQTKYGNNALLFAINSSEEHIARYIAYKFRNVKKDVNRLSPLVMALDREKYDLAHDLIARLEATDINDEDDNNRHFPLFVATVRGNIDTVKRLLEKGADVNKIHRVTNTTSLARAVYNGNTEIIQALIDAGADVDLKGQDAISRYYGMSAREIATKKGIVLPTASAPAAPVAPVTSTTPAAPAAPASSVAPAASAAPAAPVAPVAPAAPVAPVASAAMPVVSVEATKTFEKTSVDPKDNTIDYLFSYIYNERVYDALNRISYMTNVDVRDKYGNTPLMYAIVKRYNEIAQKLIYRGADVNALNDMGGNSLHIASEYNNFEGARLLVRKRVKIDKKMDNGTTPLQHAAVRGFDYICEFLIDNGANVNNYKNDNVTSLHYAVYACKLTTVQLLLENGANPTMRDNAGRYAIDVIYDKYNKCQQNLYYIVKALYDAMKRKRMTEEYLSKYKTWLDDDKNKQTAQYTQYYTERPTSIAFFPRAAKETAQRQYTQVKGITSEYAASALLTETTGTAVAAAKTPVPSTLTRATVSPRDIIKQELAQEQAKAASPASSPAEKRAASAKVEELSQDLALLERAQAVLESSKEAVLESSKAAVLKSSEEAVLESSKAAVLESSKAAVLESSEEAVLESSEEAARKWMFTRPASKPRVDDTRVAIAAAAILYSQGSSRDETRSTPPSAASRSPALSLGGRTPSSGADTPYSYGPPPSAPPSSPMSLYSVSSASSRVASPIAPRVASPMAKAAPQALYPSNALRFVWN